MKIRYHTQRISQNGDINAQTNIKFSDKKLFFNKRLNIT